MPNVGRQGNCNWRHKVANGGIYLVQLTYPGKPRQTRNWPRSPATMPANVRMSARAVAVRRRGNGEHCYLVFPAFPLANRDLPALKVDVFDTQLRALHQPHASAVQ